MRNSYASIVVASLAFITLSPSRSSAQQGLRQPEPSPAASVTQMVGLTELKVTYHRPGLNGRQGKIFGDLVPYGEVWRAGANQNTTISFSSPVKVGGKTLAAGTYGLHMIPTARDWTVILSNTSVAWGSYGYDQKEDAVRLQTTPQAGEGVEERLSFRFDNPTETSALVTLRWDKVKVAFPVEVDTSAVVMAHMREELRGAAQFTWQGWAQAAQYFLSHGGNIDEAQRMADRSIAMHPAYQNLSTRAAIAEKKGDSKLAAELNQKALAVATEADLNQQGYKLLGQKKFDEAIVLFRKIAADHPASWNAHDSLAEALLAKGDRKAAVEEYGKALSMVKDSDNRKRIEQLLTRLKGK
jgi:hypothetical protein